ncbi:MAG: hypothetical protein EPO61_09960 [Nitrospirae bacterium]|nr:MAG: hypothetical protein EPO61_09960 [Nitrospirota bacterium]
MRKPLILGGLFGGLALFVWGAISYMALPWHGMMLEKFTDEAVVAQALTANASRSGMYILPNPHKHEPGMTAAQQQAAEEGAKARMMSGPFLFASVSLGGTRDMGQALLLNVLSDILAAALATWLLLQTAHVSYWRRVGFVVVMALTAGVVAHVPSWIWWTFSTSFTLVEFADLLIGWGLAGLVIAKVAGSLKAGPG